MELHPNTVTLIAAAVTLLGVIIVCVTTLTMMFNRMDAQRKKFREELLADRSELNARQLADRTEFNEQQRSTLAEFHDDQHSILAEFRDDQRSTLAEFRDKWRAIGESLLAAIQVAGTRVSQAELDIVRKEAMNDIRLQDRRTHTDGN